MTFGEKIRNTRINLNLSQADLAKKTGISERSLYTYENGNVIPRNRNIIKLAEAMNVSVNYLLDEEEKDPTRNLEQDIFIANVRNRFGSKGAREASEILSRTSALFAGGALDESAKEIFFQALMEVYLDSKKEARDKFSPKKRVRKKK